MKDMDRRLYDAAVAAAIEQYAYKGAANRCEFTPEMDQCLLDARSKRVPWEKLVIIFKQHYVHISENTLKRRHREIQS